MQTWGFFSSPFLHPFVVPGLQSFLPFYLSDGELSTFSFLTETFIPVYPFRAPAFFFPSFVHSIFTSWPPSRVLREIPLDNFPGAFHFSLGWFFCFSLLSSEIFKPSLTSFFFSHGRLQDHDKWSYAVVKNNFFNFFHCILLHRVSVNWPQCRGERGKIGQLVIMRA